MKNNFLDLANCSSRVNEHESNDAEQEHDLENNRDAVEILLDDARATLRGVEGARNHIRNARALTGVQQDEYDKASARNEQQYE